MAPALEIRDPIHGFIFREPYERQIIDTPVFQRLRRLKQLAMGVLVYPGATHTRFDHSLGAFCVASKVAEQLLPSASEKRLVRLAALLHDLGHGPFSHVSEEIYEETTDRSKLKLKPRQQIHEAITEKLILGDKDLSHLLSQQEREQIVGLLSGTYGDTILKDIVSGPVDVDKQDYLLRDSYYCGVKYGVYDPARLTETLRVNEDAYDRFLALSPDGVHALEQFVLAKYYMSTQVYRHKIRLVTDEMIVRGIVLGIKTDGIEWLRDLYTYVDSDQFLARYLDWHDEKLMWEILNPDRTPEGYARNYFRRLAERRLFKVIFVGKPSEFTPNTRRTLFEGSNRKLFRDIEKAVAAAYGRDANEVLFKRVTHKSVRTQATTNEGAITVLRPGRPRPFHEESALFSSINEAIQEEFVHIYVPIEYKDEKDKKKHLADFSREIGEIIEQTTQFASSQRPLPLRGIAEGEGA